MRRKGIHVDMLVSDSDEDDKLEEEEVSRHHGQRAMQQLKSSHQRVAHSQPTRTHNNNNNNNNNNNRVSRILAATSPKQRGSRRGNRNLSEIQDGEFGLVREGLRNVRDNGQCTEDDTVENAQDDFDCEAPLGSKARAKKSRALWYASSED